MPKVIISSEYENRFIKLCHYHCGITFAIEIGKTKQVGDSLTSFIAPDDSSKMQITRFKKFAKAIESKRKIKKVLKKYT